MQQKVDLNALRALSSRLKQTDMRLEQQISEMQRTLKALLSRIRSDYPERYVHTAVEHAEGDLQEVWKLAIRISELLSKQAGHLNWSAEHYLRTESLLKNLHLQNPFLQATKTASFTAITRFTGNNNTTDPPKRNLISASETLLSRLKQLWWKFYDGLLMKKLGEYQQGDPRIITFIQTIENGTPLEQKEAREKLSVILHAFDEIARSQTAYHVYKQFGNEQNTLAALKNADEQRRVLAELGVSKQWYASGVDLSKQYPNSPLSACTYNPLQDGAKMPEEAELRMAITLGLKNEPYGEWAKMNYNEIEQAVKQAAAVREKERQIAEYKRLNDPPTELPDGTPITPKNKENETTYDYFVERIYDPDRWDANLLLEYDTWLNDTYGKTEWRKKVELADRVTYEFASSLIKETIMGGVDTVKLGYKLVVDPQQTTQEILDSAAYLVNNPEVLVEAARTVYKNFEEGTPEERAGMLGSVASVLVPGVSITKVSKVSKVTGGLQDVSKLIDKVQDVNKVFRKPESLADLLPFTSVVTPEGVRMIVRKEFPGQGQVHRVEAPEGSRGMGNGGTPKAPKYNTKIKWGINDINVRPHGKGFFGERIPQSNPRVDDFELKINPNNESYYLPHPKGGYVQFENLIDDVLQDGKLIIKPKSFYHVDELPEFAKNKVIQEALRQQDSAIAAGYKVEWLVSDKKAVDQLTNLFKSKNIEIDVNYFPE